MAPSPSPSKQRKKPQHLRHGSSLPLLAFAGAKKTTYDPRIAKQKAAALAAKRVNEFRKLKARLEAEGKLAVPSAVAKAFTQEAAGSGGGGEERPSSRPPPPQQQQQQQRHQHHHEHDRKRHSNQKPLNTLQRLAARNDAARAEAAAARAAAAEAAAVRRQQLLAAERQRKERTALMRKRTSKGQPVMKHRIEGVLSKLIAEATMSGGGGGRR